MVAELSEVVPGLGVTSRKEGLVAYEEVGKTVPHQFPYFPLVL